MEPDTLGELDHVNMGSRIGPWDQSSLEGQFDPETPEYPRIRRKSVLPMDSSVLTALTHHKSLEVCKKRHVNVSYTHAFIQQRTLSRDRARA